MPFSLDPDLLLAAIIVFLTLALCAGLGFFLGMRRPTE